MLRCSLYVCIYMFCVSNINICRLFHWCWRFCYSFGFSNINLGNLQISEFFATQTHAHTRTFYVWNSEKKNLLCIYIWFHMCSEMRLMSILQRFGNQQESTCYFVYTNIIMIMHHVYTSLVHLCSIRMPWNDFIIYLHIGSHCGMTNTWP